jgi:hypothetical protein
MGKVMGICVSVKDKRPTAFCVVMDGSKTQPTNITTVKLTTSETDIAGQLVDLARGLTNYLGNLGVSSLVVRRADIPAMASNTEGPRTRLLCEGALVAASREAVPETRLLNGRDVAILDGRKQTKALLEEEAQKLVTGKDFAPAAAACIALMD